ncbi:glycosyltransferase [Clostridium sp.]|uniref:glycosyltransferase n=1 Tax=Clostridium sp. TaxID=1506 RepID=UPI0026DAA7F8|nr:glycosyltransferase [Clostridium sp.]MDO5040077.1 glycosyltransferase [Clostridium sp.]
MNNKKIKILHVAQANGGVSEYLKSFLKYSNKNIFQNYLLVSNLYKTEEEIYNELVDDIKYLDMKREISLKSDLKSIMGIIRYLRNNNVDIIYSHSSKAGALVRIAAIFTKTPVIYNSHGWAFDMNVSNKKKNVYILIEKMLAKLTKKIICISKNDYDKALEYKICKENKLALIENGIDIEKFNKSFNASKIKNKYNIPINKLVVGMVARISEQKSPETFVEIASRLCKINDNFHFIMVGDGEEREKIDDLIKKLGISEKFTITGWVNNTAEIISIFDIALLTSKWEGFGLVIPEYFISKVPVIASSVGGIKNIINNGINGRLVENNDIEKYIEYIFQYINDNDFRDKIIEKAYLDANIKYNISRVVQEHEKIFKSCIKTTDKDKENEFGKCSSI